SEDDVTHSIQRLDVATLAAGDLLADRGRRVSCLCFSTDGELVALGGPDGSVRIWNFVKKERVGGDRPAHAKALGDLTITPDKKRLVTGDERGEIKVWDLAGGQNLRTFQMKSEGLMGLTVSADGQRLAALGPPGYVELYELESGRLLRQWALPTEAVASAFTPDGRGLVTANRNST